MKKLLAFILSASMAFSSLCGAAFASDIAESDTYQWVNVATKATITCGSGDNGGFLTYTPTNIIDASKTSYALAPAGTEGIVFDLGKEYAVTKLDITLYPHHTAFILQGSNDGAEYTNIKTVEFTEAEVTDDTLLNKIEEFENNTTYRWYRIAPVENSAGTRTMAIADVQLLVNYNIQPANWEKSRVISNLDVKVAVSSDDVNMTSHSQMTDDNIEGAYTQAAAGAEYILYDLGQIFPITELRAIYRGESAAFSIFGSADGNTYDLIYTAITTGAYYSPDDTGSIYLDRPEYRYIKFVRPNQDKLIGIRELYLYTTLPTEEYWKELHENECWFDASIGAAVSEYTSGAAWNPVSANITDGNSATYSAASPCDYITFDLGGSYKLGGFNLQYNYRSGMNFTLYGSNDNDNWVKLYKLPATTQTATDEMTDDVTGYFEHNNYRYVKIQSDKTGVMKIYELKVFGIGDKVSENDNLALGTCTNYPAITDGVLDTYQNVLSANKDFVLDMGKAFHVGAVNVYYSNRAGNYTVYGSADGNEYIPLTKFIGTAADINSAVIENTGCVYVRPGSYRYIKLVNTNNILNLAEIQVFGTDPDAPAVTGITKNEIDSDGNWIFTYSNATSASIDFCAIAAMYDVTGKTLKNVKIYEKTVRPRSVYNGIISPEFQYNDNCITKCFLWDTEFTPLSNAVPFVNQREKTTLKLRNGVEKETIKINVLGDSITSHAFADKPYQDWWADYYNIKVTGYGVSGSCVGVYDNTDGKSYLERADGMRDDADVIFVYGGTNDAINHSTKIGTIDDNTDQTFYGAYNLLINKLKNKYPTSEIVLSTILHSGIFKNGQEVTFGNAIKELGKKHSLKVVDIYNDELDFTKADLPYASDCYMMEPNMKLHPSNYASKLVGGYMMSQMIEQGVFEIAE